MQGPRFVVVDSDPFAGNALFRALSEIGYTIPISSLDELGDPWPDECLIFVADQGGQFQNAIRRVKDRGVFYPLIPYRSAPEVSQVVDAIRHGAMSYLPWPCDPRKLVSVVDKVMESAAHLFDESSRRKDALDLLKTLTRREVDVLELMASGLTSRAISSDLGISYRTVEVHRNSILSKLKVQNAVGAVRIAVEQGMGSAPLQRH